ncbi:dTMP kinase [Chloroflexota bacterium]
MALFVTFEGGEGCGKSTQARALYKQVSAAGIPVVLTHEPGGTPLGSRVRHLLKRVPEVEISPLTELLLINASRAQLVRDVIGPNLAKGTMVICDRYADSTVAYQGYGRGLGSKVIEEVNYIATKGLLPDLAVLMDIPVEIGLARKRLGRWDRFELEDSAFHQRVREGYLRTASADPYRWLVIDATLSRGRIRGQVWERVRELLS